MYKPIDWKDLLFLMTSLNKADSQDYLRIENKFKHLKRRSLDSVPLLSLPQNERSAPAPGFSDARGEKRRGSFSTVENMPHQLFYKLRRRAATDAVRREIEHTTKRIRVSGLMYFNGRRVYISPELLAGEKIKIFETLKRLEAENGGLYFCPITKPKSAVRSGTTRTELGRRTSPNPLANFLVKDAGFVMLIHASQRRMILQINNTIKPNFYRR